MDSAHVIEQALPRQSPRRSARTFAGTIAFVRHEISDYVSARGNMMR